MEKNLNEITITEKYWNWKKFLSITLKIIVGLIILYFIISLVQWENVVSAFLKANKIYIFFAFTLLILNIGIRSLRWHIMLKSVKKNPAFIETLGSLMFGISLGSITPVEIGEYAGRALHISEAKKSHVVGLALVDKVQILIVTSTIGGICLLTFFISKTIFITISSSLIILLAAFILLYFKKIVSYLHKIHLHVFRTEIISRIMDGAKLLTPVDFWITLGLTLIFHLTIVFQMYLLLNAFYEVTIIQAFIGTSAVMFAKSYLPISLGDLGVREATSIYFFSYYGIPSVASLNASMLLFLINIFTSSLIGIYFIKHQNYSIAGIFNLFKRRKPS